MSITVLAIVIVGAIVLGIVLLRAYGTPAPPEPRREPRHAIKDVLGEFPDLAHVAGMDDAALKQLQAKYSILVQITEQSLKDRELSLKEGSARIDRFANPLMVGVMVGALGLVGSFVNGLWSNRNQQAELENQNRAEQIKLRNDLIKEAIKPADEKERAKSLVFFAKNGLIQLDSQALASLVLIAGSERPVPGSSGALGGPGAARPISFMQAVVDRIAATPGVPYPKEAQPTSHEGDPLRKAIVLHDAIAGDGSVTILRRGFGSIPGPLAHWAVRSDGSIAFIADESQRANHVGRAERDISNANTIGISVTGISALSDDRQTENLVRLVADVANRWNIPTEMILGHGEISSTKVDMRQQAEAIRAMVAVVRTTP